jgi:IMP cyclohydrolase
MYVGRIVTVGMTPEGKNFAAYRVSSRSFPNREALIKNGKVSIMPRKGFESDLTKNPYIAYNCIQMAGDYAIVTNGSQTDPIAEKINSGMSVRDAIAFCLLALDYEKDDYNTPRIVAVTHKTEPVGFLGVIRKDAIHVTEMSLKAGELYYVATYEHATPSKCHYNDKNFNAETAEEICKYVINKGVFADLEHPVTSAAAVADGNSFSTAVDIAE